MAQEAFKPNAETPAPKSETMMDETTATSAAPMATVERPREGMSTNKVFAFVMTAAILVMAVFVVGTLVLKHELEETRAATQRASEWTKKSAEESQRILVEQLKNAQEQLQAIKDIEVQSPPTNDKLFSILSRGIGVNEDVIRTGQVGTTPIAAFATDLTSAQATDAYTQEIVITNRDDASTPSNNLCFRPIAWALPTTCNTTCSTSGFTCPAVGGAGASTDGVVTAKGASWNRRYDGTSCICLVASAASTEYQTERVLR